MIGRAFGGASVAIMQGLLTALICVIAGFRTASFTPWLLALVFMVLMAVMFTAFGTALASVIDEIQAFQLVMQFLIMPLFFLSGSLFPLRDVPRALQIVASLDPVSYGVDGLRVALTGAESHFGLAVDLGAICVIAALMILLSARFFSKIEI